MSDEYWAAKRREAGDLAMPELRPLTEMEKGLLEPVGPKAAPPGPKPFIDLDQWTVVSAKEKCPTPEKTCASCHFVLECDVWEKRDPGPSQIDPCEKWESGNPLRRANDRIAELEWALAHAVNYLPGVLLIRNVGKCEKCGGMTSSGMQRLCRGCVTEECQRVLRGDPDGLARQYQAALDQQGEDLGKIIGRLGTEQDTFAAKLWPLVLDKPEYLRMRLDDAILALVETERRAWGQRVNDQAAAMSGFCREQCRIGKESHDGYGGPAPCTQRDTCLLRQALVGKEAKPDDMGSK